MKLNLNFSNGGNGTVSIIDVENILWPVLNGHKFSILKNNNNLNIIEIKCDNFKWEIPFEQTIPFHTLENCNILYANLKKFCYNEKNKNIFDKFPNNIKIQHPNNKELEIYSVIDITFTQQ